MGRLVIAILFVLSAPLAAGACPIDVPVDSSLSQVEVELCILGNCDTATSPLTGYVNIDLDSVPDPGEVVLWDFDLSATEDLTHSLFLGAFNSTLSGLRVYDPRPAEATLPADIIADAFEFLNVGVLTEGIVDYTATGTACLALVSFGLPCADQSDLSAGGEQTADQVSGMLTTSGRTVTLTGLIDSTQPIDPLNPGLGTVRLTATIEGRVTLPKAGDMNGDEAVNLDDFLVYVGCFGSSVAIPAQGCTTDQAALSDMNCDGLVDLADFPTFVQNFGT